MIREEAVCIMPLHTGKGCTESKAISGSMEDLQKTVNGRLITGYGCDSRTVDAEFLLAEYQYIAAARPIRGADDVIAYHVIFTGLQRFLLFLPKSLNFRAMYCFLRANGI